MHPARRHRGMHIIRLLPCAVWYRTQPAFRERGRRRGQLHLPATSHMCAPHHCDCRRARTSQPMRTANIGSLTDCTASVLPVAAFMQYYQPLHPHPMDARSVALNDQFPPIC